MTAPSILGQIVLGETLIGVVPRTVVAARPTQRHGSNRPALTVEQDAERLRLANQPTKLLPERHQEGV